MKVRIGDHLDLVNLAALVIILMISGNLVVKDNKYTLTMLEEDQCEPDAKVELLVQCILQYQYLDLDVFG